MVEGGINLTKKNARDIALELLSDIEQNEAFSNIALNRALERYQPEKQDRGFITELFYGTLRTLNTIDWILGNYLKKPLNGLPVMIRNILRMGVYQIYYMDKVPDSAACNESAALARKYGHEGTVKLVNGVLRNVARNREKLQFPDIANDPVTGIALKYSHPEWLVKRWVEEFGVKETEAFCRANNEIPPNSIRTNTLMTNRPELKQTLANEGINSVEGRFAPETLVIDGFKSVGSIAAHKSGLFMVQDESSTLVGHALSPSAGSFVIDACSAPGGKSTHMAQLMRNTGHIVSADIHSHKMDLIKENAERLRIDIIETVVLDAVELDKQYEGKADFVLVDAPCSGLGVLRRRPEIRWRKTADQINELSQLQLNILGSAAKCLKPGGIIVYSTCTVTQEENINVINRFLEKHPDFELETLADKLPKELLNISGTESLSKGFVQFLPHIHGTDGFFIARLKKRI